jgi:serine/threonine protein kinase
MYAIAWLIGQHGVIHGDLKPDQYLFNYRKRKTDPVKDIALTDFGFAGLVTQVRRKQNAKIQTRTTKQSHIFPISRKKFGLAEMGWPSNEKSPNSFGVCKSGLIELTTPNEASLMNIAHLEAFLISDGSRIPTFVIDDRLPEKDRELLLFTGVDRFLSAVKANHKIRLWFPGTFFSEYANCVRVWKKESENLCFNFHDIVKAAR